jgi:hypothetical protein
MAMKFKGESGRKPQTEARMYVYRCIAAVLDNDTEQSDNGWFGLPDGDEFDRRRLKKAITSVTQEMIRKGGGDPRLSAQGPWESLTVAQVGERADAERKQGR